MTAIEIPFQPGSEEQLARRTDTRRSDGRWPVPYVYTPDIEVAVNAALVTDRPLLLRGEPGSGKSTLARDVALALGRSYYEETITSRTTAADLLWRFDAVARLGDASFDPKRAAMRKHYLEPSTLWWAFDPNSVSDSARPRSDPGEGSGGAGAVVLLDEIDKADPDVPNDLLLVLGEKRFVVADADDPRPTIERKRKVLVMITSNGERDLPPAFLRRCVSLTLHDPVRGAMSNDAASIKLLDMIVQLHLEVDRRNNQQLNRGLPLASAKLAGLIARIITLYQGQPDDVRRPGTAEFLDAVRAILALGYDQASEHWKLLTRSLLFKEMGNPDVAATSIRL
jgi:MoxR-like ATPase